MVEDGRVTINGTVAQLGDRIQPGQKVCVDGKPVSREDERILLAYHKPKGIVCTSAKKEKNNIIDYLNYPKRIYPIGRLDKYSEGLLLMTNKGELVNGIMRSRYGHEKEYIVTVDRPVTDELLRRLTNGIQLSEDEYAKPCFAEKTARNKFRMIITQGLNRQIRRMCEKVGCRVTKLKRVRIIDIELGDLPVGEYRKATPKELKSVLSRIDD